VLAHQPAHAAADGEAAHSRRRDLSADGCLAVLGGRFVDRPPVGAATDAHRPRRRIDRDGRDVGKVDHQSAVDGPEAGHVVASAPHGEGPIAFVSEADRCRHVAGIGSPEDGTGTPVDSPVPDAPGDLVVGVSRRDQAPAHDVRKLVERASVQQTSGCARVPGHPSRPR
jgi:hypothetical protein